MGILVSLLLALVVAAAIGVAATWYLRRVRLPREEAAAGVAALSDMRWRDFIKLVLDVLAGRGFTRVSDPEAASDEGDIPLERLLTMVLDAGFEGSFDLEVMGPRVEEEGYHSSVRRSVERASELLDRVGA